MEDADAGYASSTGEASWFALWHLLSFDAPTIAVIWTMFTASATHTVASAFTLGALALAVWILYALDRILDTRHLPLSGSHATGIRSRHLFHRKHRSAFLAAIGVASCVLGLLLPRIPWAQLRLYSVEAVGLTAYFAAVHLSSRSLPKEILVGPFFSAAVFIPAISQSPTTHLLLLLFAALFAGLCSLNCLYIHAWEHSMHGEGHWATTSAIRNLTGWSNLFLASAFLLCILTGMRSPSCLFRIYPVACAASVLLLRVVHQVRSRFTPLALRVAADAALLTPLLFLPFLRR